MTNVLTVIKLRDIWKSTALKTAKVGYVLDVMIQGFIVFVKNVKMYNSKITDSVILFGRIKGEIHQ
jgi:hypothetical protein